MQTSNGSAKIFLGSSGSGTSSIIQIQSGEIAGNLAADIALIAAKNSLDDLTKNLVAEFNEVHRFGVDLNGDIGKDFFRAKFCLFKSCFIYLCTYNFVYFCYNINKQMVI